MSFIASVYHFLFIWPFTCMRDFFAFFEHHSMCFGKACIPGVSDIVAYHEKLSRYRMVARYESPEELSNWLSSENRVRALAALFELLSSERKKDTQTIWGIVSQKLTPNYVTYVNLLGEGFTKPLHAYYMREKKRLFSEHLLDYAEAMMNHLPGSVGCSRLHMEQVLGELDGRIACPGEVSAEDTMRYIKLNAILDKSAMSLLDRIDWSGKAIKNQLLNVWYLLDTEDWELLIFISHSSKLTPDLQNWIRETSKLASEKQAAST
jgi:hypothetical protein